MPSQTTVKASLVTVSSGRGLEDKLGDSISCLDYGATIGGSAAANTTAINAAIQAARGFVFVPPGVSYTEASIVFKDDVALIVFSAYCTFSVVSKDYGHPPIAKGGIAVKPAGQSGVLLRSVDFGVADEPFLQVVDYLTGDIAATHTKFIEMDEISAPANPSANKCRLYTKDNGSTKTQLVVQFPTGVVIPLATEGTGPNLKGTATYDPASIADGTGVTTTVTVTDAVLGDFVVVSFDKDLQGIILSGYVSAAGVVSCRFQNETGGALDLASGTLSAMVLRNI